MQYSNADVFCDTSELQKHQMLAIFENLNFKILIFRISRKMDFCNLVEETITSALNCCVVWKAKVHYKNVLFDFEPVTHFSLCSIWNGPRANFLWFQSCLHWSLWWSVILYWWFLNAGNALPSKASRKLPRSLAIFCLKATKYSKLQQTSERVRAKVIVHVCRNHQRRVTDVHSICIAMFRNRTKMLENHYKIEQSREFRNGFSNWRCHFQDCHLDFDRCIILMRICFATPMNFKNVYCSWHSNNSILKCFFSLKSSIRSL